MSSPRSRSPTDKPEEINVKENPEITGKSKSEPMETNGQVKSYEEEERKGDPRESAEGQEENRRKDSRSASM